MFFISRFISTLYSESLVFVFIIQFCCMLIQDIFKVLSFVLRTLKQITRLNLLILKTSLICDFLFCRKLIMPSFYVHDSLWWNQNIRIRLLPFIWNKVVFVLSITPLGVSSLNQKWSCCSAFFGRCEIIFKELIKIFITDDHVPFFVLKI